jgi:hypothetical protein
MMTIEDRIRGFEARIESARADARACVRELLVDDGARYLIAERLPALGSVIIPAVRELIDDPGSSHEIRTLAALAGAEVGDSEQSILVLLEELEHRGEFAPLAARRLAVMGPASAVSAIEEALRQTPVADVDSVVAYLEALRDLGVHPSPEERQRLEGGGEWQVTSALAEWHPPPFGEA